jgi:hypothetical protein
MGSSESERVENGEMVCEAGRADAARAGAGTDSLPLTPAWPACWCELSTIVSLTGFKPALSFSSIFWYMLCARSPLTPLPPRSAAGGAARGRASALRTGIEIDLRVV